MNKLINQINKEFKRVLITTDKVANTYVSEEDLDKHRYHSLVKFYDTKPEGDHINVFDLNEEVFRGSKYPLYFIKIASDSYVGDKMHIDDLYEVLMQNVKDMAIHVNQELVRFMEKNELDPAEYLNDGYCKICFLTDYAKPVELILEDEEDESVAYICTTVGIAFHNI